MAAAATMPGGRARWTRIAVPAVVLVLAAVLRLWGLESPTNIYWDEHYYVFDARAYLGGGFGQPIPGAPPVKIANEGTWMHPPLGKWAIALLGVGPIGIGTAVGWRLPSALFGIAGVGLLYLLALRLWGSVWWAGCASLLLALDGLHIVQSRIAMLDIFLSTFIVAGVLFAVLDRERVERKIRSKWRRTERVFGSPYRFWAGVMLGSAVATKWTGALALVFVGALSTVWLLAQSRRGEASSWSVVRTILASYLVVPIACYLLAYGQFFYQHGPALASFLELQRRMLDYQLGHRHVQFGSSSPWTWPVLAHPIRYLGVGAPEGGVRLVVALGNPALWWGFLALLPVAAVLVTRRPTWQDAVAFGGYAALFLPWLLVRRSQFLFYLLPAVPFMCLCVVATLRRLPGAWARGCAALIAGLAVLATIAFFPIWSFTTIPRTWANALRWLPGWRW